MDKFITLSVEEQKTIADQTYISSNCFMKTKSLIETNPYLKDPATRKKLVARSVKTSGRVEGIKSEAKPTEETKLLIKILQRKRKKSYKSLNSIVRSK